MIDEARLREILEDDLGCDLEGVEADSLLFSTGIVDSFALVTLIVAIEKEAGIKVDPTDLTLENFNTIELMLAFIERKAA